MSALGQKLKFSRSSADVRFMPLADIPCGASLTPHRAIGRHRPSSWRAGCAVSAGAFGRAERERGYQTKKRCGEKTNPIKEKAQKRR
jgi:hypothetical protein